MSQSGNSSKRQARRDQMRRKESRGRNIGMILIVLGALFIAFLIIWPNVKPIGDVKVVALNPRPQADANHMGDPNALVKITEFSDYQCPFCKRFFKDTEAALVESYVSTGKVYFTYRSAGNWVSNNIGGGKTESEDAAMAAYCAGDQNLFWEMHDMLFANNNDVEDKGSFVPRRLSVIAEKIDGLDVTKFNDCYSNNKYKSQVDLDFKDAVQAGVQGTPTFVLTYKNAAGEMVPFTYTDDNGKVHEGVIEGAQPFSFFQKQIDGALALVGK